MSLRFADLRTTAAVTVVMAAVSCGSGKNSQPRTRVTTASSGAREIVVIATERSDRGGRLVGVAIDGSRQSELTDLGGQPILDRSPVVSSDGNWVVFASNRLRQGLPETSLWVVPIGGGTPTRLTDGTQIDRDPRLSPDNQWLYFSSNRGGRFALYRAPIDLSRGTLGSPDVVARGEGQMLSPSLSPDGERLVYMEVDSQGESRLWVARADGRGEPAPVTAGPSDMTPAWGPDGLIAFSSRAPGREDADVYLISLEDGERRPVADTTITDETGPRWSSDGRYLFAIGMYRSAVDGQPLLGSVIALDRQEQVPRWRALHDPSTVETRIGLGLLPVTLDARALHENKDYKSALSEVITREARRNLQQRAREHE